MPPAEPSRRAFLKATAISAGVLASTRLASAALGANDRVRFGVIGCGGMGTGHLNELVARRATDNVEVPAVCDVYQRRLSRASQA